MEPLVSVIIPVYNPGEHFEKCLKSIIGQTYKHLQIILIDDGSTDGSEEICDRFAKKDNRIICCHQNNAGVSAARNKGIELATGDYYHFPDSDDYLEPDAYEYLLGVINHNRCDVVSFEHYGTWSNHEEIHQLDDGFYGLFDNKTAQIKVMTKTPFAWNKFFSKRLIVGDDNSSTLFFNEEIYRGEDSLFVQEVFTRAKTVFFDKRALYHYVQSEESLVRGVFRPSQLTAAKLYDKYEPILLCNPELRRYFYVCMSHLMIRLYFDMWIDKEDYDCEQKTVYDTFKKHRKDFKEYTDLNIKDRVKFSMFFISPTAFCYLHKWIHRL